MELTTVTKINVEDALVTITINPENLETKLEFSYTCTECAGRGCNNHQQRNNSCRSGTVHKVLKFDDLNSDSQLNTNIKTAIANLYNKIVRRVNM